VKNITVYLPEKWIEKLDELSRKEVYPNRSEALRYLIREGMKKEGIWDEMMETVRVEAKNSSKKTVTKEKALEFVEGEEYASDLQL